MISNFQAISRLNYYVICFGEHFFGFLSHLSDFHPKDKIQLFLYVRILKTSEELLLLLSVIPLKTRVAHRACISAIGIMAPVALSNPMKANVGRSRNRGKILL